MLLQKKSGIHLTGSPHIKQENNGTVVNKQKITYLCLHHFFD